MFSIELQFANFINPRFLIGLNVWEWYSEEIESADGEIQKGPKVEGQSLEIGFLLFSIIINKIRESES